MTMTKRIVHVLTAFTLILAQPFGYAASKKSDVTKNKKSSHAFKLIPFKDVVRLERSTRIQYVYELRKMIVDLEKFNNSIKGNSKYSSFLQINPDSRELYAMLLGNSANAQGSTGGRGTDSDDECIYAFHSSRYPEATSTGDQGGRCIVPTEATCTTAGGKSGVRCDYSISGISEKHSGGCIESTNAWKSSTLCYDEMKRLAKANDAKTNQIVNEAGAFFSKSGLNKSDLESDEAKRHLENLADHAYDDRAYAMLLEAIGIYNRLRVNELPVSDKLKAFAPDVFADRFDSLQDGIQRMFGRIIAHCNSPVDAGIVSQLEDEAGTESRIAGASESFKIQERRRVKELKEFRATNGASATPKVKDILEKPECIKVTERRDAIARQAERIAHTLPDNPTGPTVIKPVGCTADVVQDQDQLYQPGAQCAVCMAERDVIKNDTARYFTSTRWMSLLSTMAVSCMDAGQSNDGKSLVVSPEKMLQYIQTFGHCNAETYEWAPGGMREDQKALIKKWNREGVWQNAGDKSRSERRDEQDDFQKVFGIRYNDAFEIFCQKDVTKPKSLGDYWDRLKGKITSRPRKPNREARDVEQINHWDQAAIAKSRKEFAARLEGNRDLKIDKHSFVKNEYAPDSEAGKLKSCMKESLARARRIYTGNKTCNRPSLSYAECAVAKNRSRPECTNFSREFSSMFDSVANDRGGAMMYYNTDCFVSKQIETIPGGVQKPGVTKEPEMLDSNMGFMRVNKLNLKTQERTSSEDDIASSEFKVFSAYRTNESGRKDYPDRTIFTARPDGARGPYSTVDNGMLLKQFTVPVACSSLGLVDETQTQETQTPQVPDRIRRNEQAN